VDQAAHLAQQPVAEVDAHGIEPTGQGNAFPQQMSLMPMSA
jgi:hypothetical protein